jgi:hypothetical protein
MAVPFYIADTKYRNGNSICTEYTFFEKTRHTGR